MRLITLRYSYKRANDEKMVFVCRATLRQRETLAMIKQDVRTRLEAKVGPIKDLTLEAQGDPNDILMLEAMKESE